MNKIPLQRRWILPVVAPFAIVLALLTMMLFAPGAKAAEPPRISSFVTDDSGFLSESQTNQVSTAAAATSRNGLNVYYVLAPDFSGYDPLDWCLAAAGQSSLANNAVVFVLAYEERDSTWCTSLPEDSTIISDDQVDSAFDGALSIVSTSNPLSPQVAADAGEYFAEQLGAAASTGAAGTAVGSTGSNAATGDSSTLPYFLLLIVLIGIGLVLWLIVRSSKNKTSGGTGTAQPAMKPEELVGQAQQQLLYSDEALRNAEDDLQFARAQFGNLRTDNFANAVKVARSGLTDAFELMPKMTDASNKQQKAQYATQILSIIQAVMPPVKEAQDQLKEARQREVSAEEQLRNMTERVKEARDSLVPERQRLQDLSLRFTPVQLESLLQKPQQAEAFLDAAQRYLDQARLELNTNRAKTVEDIDSAASQLALALGAIDSIRNAEQSIGESDRVLNSAIASISADLNDVERLAPRSLSFQPLVTEAQAAIADGQQARRGNGDPLAALGRLRSAEDALDEALQPLRSASDQQVRMQAQARERLAAAEAIVSQAQSQVQQGRYRAELSVRTAVSNANSQLTRARQTVQSDPEASINASTAAEAQARSALNQLRTARPQTTQRGGGSNSMLWGMILGSALSGGGRPPRGYGAPPRRGHGGQPFGSPRRSGFGGGSGLGGGSSFRGSSGKSGGSFRGGSSGGGFRGGGGGRSGKF